MHTSLKTSKNNHLIVLVLAISSLLVACENQKSNHGSLVGLGLGISDATVVVSNLDSARLHYTEDLGFDIPKPEKYAQGIYKGSIGFSAFFPDMSALEFITLKDSTAKAKRSFIGSFLKKQEGVRLYALSTSSAKATLDWLNTRGFAIDSVQEGRGAAELPKGWDWDDGGPQWRQVSLNPKNPPAHLPGYMEYLGLPYQDYQNEKTSIYAMNRTYSNHPNGVVGMTALRIVVDNLKAARKAFKKWD